MTDAAIDWASLILEPHFLARVDRMALRRFTQPGLAEEAAAYALDKLSQDDWAPCRQYTGRAQPASYLLTLVSHFIEEFSRQRFGRPRPPEWLKREGELWVRIWQRICMERQMPQTVIDNLCANEQRDPGFVRGIIQTIKAKLPWCGVSSREIPADCYDCNNPDEAGPSLTTQLDNQALETALAELHRLVFADCPSATDMIRENTNTGSVPAAADNRPWRRLRDALALTPEEQLLLKLAHQQGLKHKQIALLLGMPPYQPGRLLKSLHERIAQAMRESGIDLGSRQDEVSP